MGSKCDNNNNMSHLFAGKIILAPMVRENSLPFRLLSLKFGADLVYTEELIDYRLSACRRLENKLLSTIDFVDDRGEVILRTCPEEKDRLILQLGSNNPDRALKAAKLVCDDVLGVDFNFGCPKSFSLSGGMGAALLDRPDQIKSLLTNCVKNLNIPITCKIRILPNLEDTLKLVKMIESCGVAAIAVHGRTKDQRPQHENNNEFLRAIAENISIPMIANGGSNIIKDYSDIIKFRDMTKASSVMVARAAMRNPSIFKSDNGGSMVPIETVIADFLKLAVRYDNYVANTKYTTQALMASGYYGGDFVHKFHAVSDFQTICDIFGLSEWYDKNKVTHNKSEFYGDKLEDTELDRLISEKKKLFQSEGVELICDNIPYVPKIYGDVTPKAQLMNHVNKQPFDKPEFSVFQLGQHCYHCMIMHKNKCYLNKTFANSKKGSEHASALLVCERLGLVDLSDYKNRTNGNNRNIN